MSLWTEHLTWIEMKLSADDHREMMMFLTHYLVWLSSQSVELSALGLSVA